MPPRILQTGSKGILEMRERIHGILIWRPKDGVRRDRATKVEQAYGVVRLGDVDVE
jgi:hypothetical protein